jgi:predicted transcriptional regulator YdeE
MVMIEVKSFRLVGLSLGEKTTNENGQSGIDCGNLWQKFGSGNYAEKIPGRLGKEIYAVYHQYEGDYTKPFSYFIGCKVKDDSGIPEEMEDLIIPGGKFQAFTAKGKIPECIAIAWIEIWNAGINRAYGSDFEVYGEKSRDWMNAEVEIFVSVK